MGRKPDLASRDRILQEAEHVIHLRGFSGASMDDIAEACGMTKANLFHHYGSKSELALAVLDFKIAEFKERKVQPLCGEGSPEKAILALFEESGKFFDGNGCKAGCFVGNIALEMSDRDEAFRERVGAFFRSMAACLERSKASGYYAPTLDSRAAAETIVALYEGAIMLAKSQRDAKVFSRVGRMAKAVLEQHKAVLQEG
jgi:TetR/AcrR family transcriptional repressor of nem operon